jgi:hypothetical protein
MSTKGIELKVCLDKNGVAYFRANDLFGYLAGIDKPQDGMKRIVYEAADALGYNDPGAKLTNLLRGLKVRDDVASNGAVLADMSGLLSFDEMFKNVILRLHATGKPFLKLMVSGVRPDGAPDSVVSDAGSGQPVQPGGTGPAVAGPVVWVDPVAVRAGAAADPLGLVEPGQTVPADR